MWRFWGYGYWKMGDFGKWVCVRFCKEGEMKEEREERKQGSGPFLVEENLHPRGRM